MLSALLKTKLFFALLLVVSTAHAVTPGKWSKLTYEEFRNRLLIRVRESKDLPVSRDIEMIPTIGKYAPELFNIKQEFVTLKKGDLYRVVGFYTSQNYDGKMDGSGQFGADVSSYLTYNLTLLKLDRDGLPTETYIQVGTKAQPGDEVVEFEQRPDELSMFEDLKLQNAKPGDVVMNVVGESKRQNEIPPYARAVVISSEKLSRVRFTFTYNYRLKMRLLNCQKDCERQIDYLGYLPLKNWALKRNPKNIHMYKFMGMTIVN